MAVTAYWYGLAFTQMGNKEIDFDDDNVKVMLTTSSYTPDQDTHNYKDDVTNEVVGSGYTAGGSVLQNPAMAYATATNVWNFDADNVTWANSSITARYAVVYWNDGGTAASSPLISYVDFGQDETSSSGDFTISWHTDGIVKVTVS
jgi:hypothetical protein